MLPRLAYQSPIFFSLDQSLDESVPVIRPFAKTQKGDRKRTSLKSPDLILATLTEEGESMGFSFASEDDAWRRYRMTCWALDMDWARTDAGQAE